MRTDLVVARNLANGAVRAAIASPAAAVDIHAELTGAWRFAELTGADPAACGALAAAMKLTMAIASRVEPAARARAIEDAQAWIAETDARKHPMEIAE